LAAKLLAFGALLITAAFSREIVNRRFRAPRPEPEPAPTPVPRVPVGAGGPPLPPDGSGGGGVDGGDGDEIDDEVEEDDWEMRNLRRHVGLEAVIAVVILSIAALLVNAAPAVSVNNSGATGVTLRSDRMKVDVTAVPGAPGPNELHFTAFSPEGAPLALPAIGRLDQVGEFQVQASLPGRNIAPIDIPVRRITTGHWIASGVSIPIRGTWRLTVRASFSDTDQDALAGDLQIG
jgi:copper transport protein